MIGNVQEVGTTPERRVALQCLESAIDAVHPRTVVPEKVRVESETLFVANETYDLDSYDGIFVLGGGNVAGHAALELEAQLGDRISNGVIVTDDPVATENIEMVEATYPIPNEQGMAGTQKILDLAENAEEEDLLLTIISGGGSALLPAPVADISLTDLQTTTNLLYEHGLDMKEANTIRKHISAIKAGRLAEAAFPATTVGLVFSDIVGNDMSAIASGLLFPDSTTFGDALSVVDQYEIHLPKRVRNYLERGYRGIVEETPDTTSDVFGDIYHHVLADSFTALSGAEAAAEDQGYATEILWSHTRGKAMEIAKVQMGIAQEIRKSGRPVSPPAVVLTGADMTGSRTRDSIIGPNQMFALSAAIECQKDGLDDVALASIATEGLDGLTKSGPAGAMVDETTATPENKAWRALHEDGAFSFLQSKDDLIYTGLTGTNVNDMHVLVVGE